MKKLGHQLQDFLFYLRLLFSFRTKKVTERDRDFVKNINYCPQHKKFKLKMKNICVKPKER